MQAQHAPSSLQSTSIKQHAHLVTHSRSLHPRINLRELLILLLPSPSIPDTKPVLKHLANILKRHPLDLREAEDDKQPADKTDRGVEAEGSGRGDSFHHGQEGRGDYYVGRPACHGVQHGADGADFVWDEFGSCGGVSRVLWWRVNSGREWGEGLPIHATVATPEL